MKAKKIIIPIVIVLALLAVLGGAFAFLWFKTDLLNFLKPSKDIFSNQIKEALDLKDVKFANYSDVLKDYKDLSDKSVKSEFNVSANLNISSLDKDVQNTINKSKLTVQSSADVKNSKSQNKIGLYTDNSEVLTVDLVTNQNKVGIGCKDISDKYYAVSLEDLVEYLKKSGSIDEESLELISKSISGEKLDPYQLLYISDDDLNHLDDTFNIDSILGLISKDCFTKKSNVEVKVDGDDVKAYGSYLTLTGADAYNFANDFLKLVKDDSVISKIATEKANMILEYSGQSKLSEKEIKEFINNSCDELLEGISSIKDETDSAIQLAIYSKNNKPVRIDFNVLEDVDDDGETVFSIEYADKKDIYTVYNNGKEYITVVNEYEKKENNEYKGKLTVKSQGAALGTLEYEIVLKDSENKIYLDLNVPLANISGKVDITSKGNIKNEKVTINGLVSFKYGKESEEIKFDGYVEYTDVTIPELNSSNSIDVLKLSEEEAEKELDAVLKKASEVLPARLKLIGVNIDASDIYKEKVTITDDNTDTTTTTTTNTIPDLQTSIDQANKMLDQYENNNNNLTPEMQQQLEKSREVLNSPEMQQQLLNTLNR